MPVLVNIQLEINHLQNYVKKYATLWHVFKLTSRYIMCCRQDYAELMDATIDGGI